MDSPIPKLSAPPGYRPQAEDTTVETDLLDFYLLRQRTGSERLCMAASLMQNARRLSLHCLQQQFSNLSPQAFARKIAEAWLQEDCPPNYIPTGSQMTWIQDSTELAAQLHSIFTAVGVAYYVTGGVAAITYGEPRTTRDLDIVLAVPRDALNPLVAALESAGFYVPGVNDVVAGKMRTLQVTQVATISRADLVLADSNDYEQLKFQRRRLISLPNGTEIYLASPEDLVVNKLRWGKQSQSEKQMRDVLGVLKTQQSNLDYEYMYRWAESFGLSEILEQATIEAGVRAIAAHQWATAAYPTMLKAFELARRRNRIQTPAPQLEIAQGNFYTLIRNTTEQTFTVVANNDDLDVVQFNAQGEVLVANLTLQDRQQWRSIAQHL